MESCYTGATVYTARGQKKNVSIINLVAEGTIEHRMLDVLKFKKRIAAGILDAGESNIFLGEDKFKQFMKSVESITAGLPVEKSNAINEADERKTEKELYNNWLQTNSCYSSLSRRFP